VLVSKVKGVTGASALVELGERPNQPAMKPTPKKTNAMMITTRTITQTEQRQPDPSSSSSLVGFLLSFQDGGLVGLVNTLDRECREINKHLTFSFVLIYHSHSTQETFNVFVRFNYSFTFDASNEQLRGFEEKIFYGVRFSKKIVFPEEMNSCMLKLQFRHNFANARSHPSQSLANI
jgi:hypothetical protein